MPQALIAPEDLPRWVPGRVLLDSAGLGWKGVEMRGWSYKGQDVQIPAMRDFMLVSYRIGTTPMQRRFDGRWTETTCGPGAVSLLTRSQPSHWHWTEDVAVTHLYLTTGFVSEVADEATGRSVEDVSLADVLRSDDPVMFAAMEAIAGEATAPGLGGALYVEAVARQLVVHLLRRYADVRLKPAETGAAFTAAQRRRLLEFLDAHLQDGLDLKALAGAVNLTPSTFTRHFRRSFGVAPHAFVMERRLDRARRLLGETATATAEVAAVCGFSDQAHLTRLFARRFGTTPAAFRRAGRGGASPAD